MLPRRYRLSRSEFPVPLRSTRSASLPAATLLVFPGVDHAKIGIIVSSRVAPRAATRTMVKRRFRAALLPLLPSLPPSRLVIIARSGKAPTVAELQETFTTLFRRTKLLS